MTLVPSLQRTLFAELIDDAGLFPPAAKGMGRAVADHAAALEGDASWMCGRFVCPVSRLAELAEHSDEVPRIVAVADGRGVDWLDGLQRDLRAIDHCARAADVESVEARLPLEADPTRLSRTVGEANARGLLVERRVAFEVDGRDAESAVRGVSAIARLDAPATAKLRCGGVVANAFPDVDVVAAFLRAAHAAWLPIKLTAGLHHPVRVWDGEFGVHHHGFLNILAVLALPEADAEAILQTTEPDRFATGDNSLSWDGRTASGGAVAEAREILRAIGSCGFAEPLELLREQRFLAPASE